MNQMNDKTQQFHEYRRQLRLQKRREQDEQGLSVKQTKTTTLSATKVLAQPAISSSETM